MVQSVGAQHEHLKRQRRLHRDRAEIVSHEKYFWLVLRDVRQASCKPVSTPCVSGHTEPNDIELEVQGADSIKEWLVGCSDWPLIQAAHNSRRMLVRKQRKSHMCQVEATCALLGHGISTKQYS